MSRNRVRADKVLSKVSIFANLDESQQFEILNKMEHQKFERDTNICTQGDVADKFYIIVNGTCSVYVQGKGKVATLTKHQFFGEAVCSETESLRSATVTADLNGTHVLYITRTVLLIFIKKFFSAPGEDGKNSIIQTIRAKGGWRKLSNQLPTPGNRSMAQSGLLHFAQKGREAESKRNKNEKPGSTTSTTTDDLKKEVIKRVDALVLKSTMNNE